MPAHVRALPAGDLARLCAELRQETIAAVSETGGHLGAGLGVVELSVALHHVFDTPSDILVWDVGHQTYPHKILTGRRDRIRTLRKPGGLSGFTRRAESPYDAFGAGHAGTALSAALGFCAARDLAGARHHVVAVVGDGAMSSGLCFEALNNAAAATRQIIVVLNDNGMSIAPAVGGLHEHLRRLAASQAMQSETSCARGGDIFSELGFRYVGPVDGHDVDQLVATLTAAKAFDGPVLVHALTEKGRGFHREDASGERFHAAQPYVLETGEPKARPAERASYSEVFARTLVSEALADERIVAITAAMPSGTGLRRFQVAYPDRFFDVGIAEQHAVTFAAGLAAGGAKPFVAIYSTFLQRAYDQIVHDVALQQLPVRFIVDRAGPVGPDGATHAGAYDLVTLCSLPGFVVMAPSDEAELSLMIRTAACLDSQPSAIRFPRTPGAGSDPPQILSPLEIGRGRVLRAGSRIAICSLGTRLAAALRAAQILESVGENVTVVDARFAKPLDEDLIRRLALEHQAIITVEEGAAGGFGAAVLTFLARAGLLEAGLAVRTLTLPDAFQEHDTYAGLIQQAGLDGASIAEACLQACPAPREAARGAVGLITA